MPRLAEEYNVGVIPALLRLGCLANEVQTVVDTLVEDLAERCIREESSGLMRIDAACLAMQPRYILRELLIAAWRRQDWPLQAMGFAQWDLLADLVYTQAGKPPRDPQKSTFPGPILASVHEGELRLERVQGSGFRVQAP